MASLTTTTTTLSLFFFFLLHLSTTTTTVAAATTHPSDITALKAIKAAINPTSIPPTSCLASWNFTSDPCSPQSPTHFLCGVSCSGNRVTQIVFFEYAGYAGTLSPLVSKLTKLTEILLDNNKLSGPIPISIFTLPNLISISLRNNSFSGTLPSVIRTPKTLQILDLSHNSLSGPLPDTSTLLNLSRLELSFNKFSGPIPKLSPVLAVLSLNSNNISGILSKPTFEKLSFLVRLDLSNNSLTGTIPNWFFQLPVLQNVNLSRNGFTALEIFKPVKSNRTFDNYLIDLDVGYNNIGGYLSVNFTTLPQLGWLSLRHNKLTGPIAKEFSRTNFAIYTLELDGNYLNGKPSKDFFSKKSKVTGSFGDNCLKRCPKSSKLCSKSQKPASICRKAYGGK